MTSLQKQLAAIAASSTHQLNLKAQKAAHSKSLLFEPRVAASQSFDSIYLICHEGFRDLCALDHRFIPFSRTIFSEQSKAEDRTQMTSRENKELDSVLEAFITLVGPRLLLKPAEKALEWLVRRFRVHEYNTECLVLTYLPYHVTPQFLALLSILPASPPQTLRFLFPYLSPPTNLPRQTIVYTAVNTPAFFNVLQGYVMRVLQAGHQGASLLSFWSSITTQAIDAILEQSQSGRKGVWNQRVEEILLRVLPGLNECLKLIDVPEAIMGCYMIIIVLVTKATLSDKVLGSLLEAVALSQENETLDACIMCLAIIAEEMSQLKFSNRVIKRLLQIPNLVQRLTSISEKCRVEKLALGCALGALESIGSVSCTEVSRTLLSEVLQCRIFSSRYISVALAALLQSAYSSTPGSARHGQLLDILTQFSEMDANSTIFQIIIDKHSEGFESLGIILPQRQDVGEHSNFISDDEDMDDLEDTEADSSVPSIFLPNITESTYLDTEPTPSFSEAAAAFEKFLESDRRADLFLETKQLRRTEAAKDPLFLSFMARLWCKPNAVTTRIAALRSTRALIRRFEDGIDFQNLIPYLLYALGDTSHAVRGFAAGCITAISERLAKKSSKAPIWGKDIYGKQSSQIVSLSTDQFVTFLSSALLPILEECVLDPKFIITSLGGMFEGSQLLQSRDKHSLKSNIRSSVISFLGSHTALTPILRVRTHLLPLFAGKFAAGVRTSALIPSIRRWCAQPESEVASKCNAESIGLAKVENEHLAALVPREQDSIELLRDIISGNLGGERSILLEGAFDRLNAIWSSMRSEARLSFSHCLLDLAIEGRDDIKDEKIRKTRALEILRIVKIDTAILVNFIESVPSTTQMPEGQPVKKRRRTSRNEMVRADLHSVEDVSKLLRRLTLVLELIESSNPGNRPALFKNLFIVLDDLQQLRHQSGSELVYLQSLILGSLIPIVNKLKEGDDQAEYQAFVRVDLLIDCIRHSASPQVQNGALLLISSLASWVPELVLHNLMPIFTFIGSTLLRQKDDYSAHIVDQTISLVVPQLAISLKTRNKNFLSGVADLLLSFTAAFEHIPPHRRLKLFRELAQTLGPGDSLFAILSLLIDRYPTSTSQRKFIPTLLFQFEPMVTLQTFKGYLDLVIDAAGPKRKISDTLFSLNEKEPAQVESSLLNLLSSLADFTTDLGLQSHITKAFKRKADTDTPRKLFASILEKIVHLSKQLTSSQRLYDCCRRVLASSLDLLPTIDLVKSTELLLSNSDHQVQVAAIKAVEYRAGNVVQSDHDSVSTLVSFLPRVEELLQESRDINVRAISVGCIDRIVERFGKKNIQAVVSIAQTLSGAQALASSDDEVRILSLLCLTSVVSILEDEAIPLLPTVLPLSIEYLKESIMDRKNSLHDAVYTLLSDVLERLAYMFSLEYLIPTLELSHQSAAAHLGDSCDRSRHQCLRSIANHVGAHEAFTAIKASMSSAIKHGYDAAHEQLGLILTTIELQTKSRMIKASPILFTLFQEVFDIRNQITSIDSNEEYDDEEIRNLEGRLIESVISMTLKLNDATFRPFFTQLADQSHSLSEAGLYRCITFYNFLASFFDKFKSIVTNYSSYILDNSTQVLEHLAKHEGNAELRSSVLKALRNSFQHDQDGFWQAPSHYSTVLLPLLKQLTMNVPIEITESTTIPTITELATASASSIENHRTMNTQLLRYLRAEEAHARLATVKCEQALTKKLREEWLGLLPEMLPFISELREDDDEMVERETQKWITMVEGVLGEDLEGMLQ
ncbi:hypothetical protein CC78DRAFT_515720 [Lojkania enalia]|uniref:U3 small nucleolar RNA-associated protein 10 n=1 Tax=Lojkania enalia TaxID=147567 RepID=A0A9P4KAT2_9PLEO|nr:hypothetical protein CC78DRAFT_515720 [Didymosphaeria enalia]